jgi:hypothetical protein
MTQEDLVREMIREMIKTELEENSTSGATPGFMTPNAFQGTSERGKKTHDQNATAASGYSLVKDDDNADPLKEGRSRYLDYKNDDSATSVQKIGRALSELNKSLNEMERVVTMASRLKTETNTSNSQLWKRTLSHLVKAEGRVLKLAHKIQELKK